VPAPGTGGAGGSGSDSGGGGGAKPGPLKIPEWGRKGLLFDDSTKNWDEIKDLFIARCNDGTLCVDLVRVYRTEDGQPSNGPCGYDHTEPLAGTDVKRRTTVAVVGICGSEPGDTGTTGDSGDPDSSPPVVPSPPVETVPAT
jgi:hypothetical protein